jgi:hypothetical protein
VGKDCDLHGLWLVMLKSAKDRLLGVDTPGQQMLPCVWYGMACLLIGMLWEVCLARMSGKLA